MEVLILGKQNNFVQVQTAIGSFCGIWCSATPIISKKYIVELDSDTILTLDDIELTDYNEPSIQGTTGITYIIGLVEEIREDIMFLRLQNAILMLEILPNPDFIQCLGRYIKLEISNLMLYDTGAY